jgi:hypothetical protein
MWGSKTLKRRRKLLPLSENPPIVCKEIVYNGYPSCASHLDALCSLRAVVSKMLKTISISGFFEHPEFRE